MVAWSLTSSGQFFHWSWKDLFPEMVQRIPNLGSAHGKNPDTNQGHRCEVDNRRADCGQRDREHFEQNKKAGLPSRRTRSSAIKLA